MKRLLLALAILLVVAVVAAVLGLMLVDDVSVSSDTVLVWHLDRPIIDYAAEPGWPWGVDEVDSGLIDIYRTLEAARTDSNVIGLALYIQNARFGFATAQEIRRSLAEMRAAGKFVECYLETAGEGSNGTLAYFVASACESIHLAPGGDINLLGLLSDRTFLRGTMDKLKIDPQFAHVGRYKSAVESYTHYENTEPAREAIEAVLDGYYETLLREIGDSRDVTEARVAELFDRAPYNASEALTEGLVDALSYPDQFSDFIDERGDDPSLLNLHNYHHGVGLSSRGNVAVVFAQGSIRRGDGGVEPWTGATYIGSRDFGKILSDLRDDKSVDAVVLRIDSPGGSALASDLILREVELLAAEKPLIVSMSDVAASGGYYIAAKADHIIAEEVTLTGSIGVFGGKLVTREFESELLGITHDTSKRGANADIYSALEPFTEDQRERVESMMRGVYDTFIAHVVAGRGMETEAVEEVAEGRVWTGGDALDVGLVDSLGGFGEALRVTRESLDLVPDAALSLEFYPESPSFFDYVMGRAQPFLPIRVPEALRALTEDHMSLLELPPPVADLANPF